MADDAPRDHGVLVYERGALLGYLTSRGGANRLRVHAAQFTEERAAKVAAEIVAEGQYTAKAHRLWKREGR